MIRCLSLAVVLTAISTTLAFAAPTDERYFPSAGFAATGSYKIPHTRAHYRYQRHRTAWRSHAVPRQRAWKRLPAVGQRQDPPSAWVAFSVPDDRALVAQPETYRLPSMKHPRRAVRIATRVAGGSQAMIHGGRPSGAPSRWCGWWLARHLGMSGRGTNLNLARNWASVGSSVGGPRVGAIVVWNHHVGRITAVEGGRVRVLSGNDGHAVRERWRSVAGAIAFRQI